jgi:putative tricarboxylic transport membrane protein
MKFNDAIIGIVIALFGALIIAEARHFPKAQHIQYGPGFLPTILGTGLALCGAILIARGFAARRTQPLLALGEWSRSPRHIFGFVLILACLAFYALFANDLGHFASSVLILWALIAHLTRTPARALAIAVLASIVIQLFFVEVLLVPLPWGILEPYSGWLVWR